jgi:amidohydrolase
MTIDIKKIIDFRHKLHRNAELSGKEFRTVEEIDNFILRFKPDKKIILAETGRAYIFESNIAGPTIMFRAELDGVPINEPENEKNFSFTKGVSHKCGHDGHMAILLALIEIISKNRPQIGKVVLLFQPAEENLTGAKKIIEDPNFKKLKPDFIFALHNLPGFEENSIIIKDNNFTSATVGMTIDFIGKPAHAATPTNAINPADASIKLINYLNFDLQKNNFKDFILATLVFAQIGAPDFGITPGNSQLKITLRAFQYADLDKMIGLVKDEAIKLASFYKLKVNFAYSDDTAQILNDNNLCQIVKNIAKENNFTIFEPPTPFRWTEDFAYFTQLYKCCYFGVGIGNSPPLHDEKYEFNDNIIIPSTTILYSIYKLFLINNNGNS